MMVAAAAAISGFTALVTAYAFKCFPERRKLKVALDMMQSRKNQSLPHDECRGGSARNDRQP